MRIVLTGASGNVGSRLLARLADEQHGHELVALARRPPQAGPVADAAAWHAVDLGQPSDEARLTSLLEEADALVHLAWLIQPSRDEAALQATNVDGTARLLAAAARAGVPLIAYSSSVGAYSPGPKTPPVDESWPTDGIDTSGYSRQKAAVERLLDNFEAEHPDTRVVRLRPGVILQPQAAAEQSRYFLGPLVPRLLLRPALLPVLPVPTGLAVQVVHAEDVAAAFVAALENPTARGAYNVAAEPVLTADVLAEALSTRPVPLPLRVVRAAAIATWRLRLQPTDPGWVDMAALAPVMSTERIRRELGWTPTHASGEVVQSALQAMARMRGGPTPVLQPAKRG